MAILPVGAVSVSTLRVHAAVLIHDFDDSLETLGKGWRVCGEVDQNVSMGRHPIITQCDGRAIILARLDPVRYEAAVTKGPQEFIQVSAQGIRTGMDVDAVVQAIGLFGCTTDHAQAGVRIVRRQNIEVDLSHLVLSGPPPV